jgi:hypothetical protein
MRRAMTGLCRSGADAGLSARVSELSAVTRRVAPDMRWSRRQADGSITNLPLQRASPPRGNPRDGLHEALAACCEPLPQIIAD